MEEVIGSTPIFSTKGAIMGPFYIPTMPYFVYILYSKKVDKYYVGETENIQDRIKSHLVGISKYTAIANDWVMVHSEEYATRLEALRREKEIKRMKSRKYIVSILSKD
jgi:putative endonuclease